ncbi:MAG: hypothetical protein JO293_01460 [Candidatus Eremiobacteraeota bacterium]|nr:hypothetical protein [Candidatus Eremiobacteraeota bacterium]MBV8281696.1 hypothetical protein [Candidatus Eremiobacteraeota bacterium]
MNDRLAGGIAAAAVLGAATGVALAPAPNRNEFVRRVRNGWRRLVHIVVNDRERIGLSVGIVATKVADLTQYVIDRISDAVAASGSPITRIRRSLARHHHLRDRAISVDAVADIILIQGAVETDEEWQTADLLARMAYPEGEIRNHLRIQRSSPAD